MRIAYLFFASIFLMCASFPAEAQRTPLFRDFPTGAVYVGHHSNPDLSSPEAYNYRTRLREASQEDVNFASHYRVVTWGCGTNCIAGAVIDVISGRVTFFPFSICCSVKQQDADFQPVLIRPNSKLIVFVGLRGEDAPDAAHFYEFTGSQFRFIASSAPFPQAPDNTPNASDVAPSDASSVAAQKAGCWSITDRQARLDCYDGKSGSSPSQGTPSPSPTVAVSAVSTSALNASNLDEMHATYKQNQARFSRDYVGKTFAAKMVVRTVVENLIVRGTFRVSFGPSFSGVDCSVSDKEAIDFATNLNAGDIVLVSGTVSDLVFGDVQLSPCQMSAGR